MITINDTEIIAEITNVSTGSITYQYAESYFELHCKLKKQNVFSNGYNKFLDYMRLLEPISQDEHFIVYAFEVVAPVTQSQIEAIPLLSPGINLPFTA